MTEGTRNMELNKDIILITIIIQMIYEANFLKMDTKQLQQKVVVWQILMCVIICVFTLDKK